MKSPDGATAFQIDNDGGYLLSGGTIRLDVAATYTTIKAPFGTHDITLHAGGVFYDDVELATVDDINSDWDTAFGWGDHANTYSLLDHTHAGGGSDRIISPDTLKNLIITDTTLIYNDGVDRINILPTISYVKSPNGINSYKITDTWAAISIAGEDRLNLTSTMSTLGSPDGGFNLTVEDNEVQFKKDTSVRFRLTDSASYIESPNSQNYISIDNTEITTNIKQTIRSDGEALTLKALTSGQKAIHAYRKSDGTRMGWVGFGSSGDYRMGMYNDNANENIELTCTGTGQVNINAPIRAESYKSNDGSVGVTQVIAVPGYNLIIKNGLITQIISN